MNRLPERSGNGELAPTPALPAHSKYDLINATMDRLEAARGEEGSLRAKIEYDDADRADDLADQIEYRTLEGMRDAHLEKSELATQPWSGSYWPIALGGAAWRYADPGFPGGMDWKANTDYLEHSRDACGVDLLSPAEKYDLLTGNSAFGLTRAVVHEGESYFRETGEVEAWMGICHGWAPAAYMVARPAGTVEVLAADGRTRIQFRPTDIKALTSLLWANGQFENRFIGRRCRLKNPPKDENGRITDLACYGENPGTWHLAAINQIGVARRSFVMDAVHDTEIWNQPITGYQYTYFNPQTREPANSIREAEVQLVDYTADKFKRYRPAEAKSVVGIAMDLTYVMETSPSLAATDSPAQDSLITVHYLYDLELDSRREIIGGEWYANAHPGFLWTPTPDAQARAPGDSQVRGSWGGTSSVPASWAKPILESARRGQPLAHVVNTLEVLSRLH